MSFDIVMSPSHPSVNFEVAFVCFFTSACRFVIVKCTSPPQPQSPGATIQHSKVLKHLKTWCPLLCLYNFLFSGGEGFLPTTTQNHFAASHFALPGFVFVEPPLNTHTSSSEKHSAHLSVGAGDNRSVTPRWQEHCLRDAAFRFPVSAWTLKA